MASAKKLYCMSGIVIAGLLAGCALTRPQTPVAVSATDTASSARPSQVPTGTASAAPTRAVPAGPVPTLSPSAPDFTVSIHSLGPEGITGTLTFKDIAGSAAVLLHLDGLPEDDEDILPVELRRGSCAAPGDLAYPLAAPDAGESETDLPIDLGQFNAQKPMAVIVYRSTQDRTAIACGDIP